MKNIILIDANVVIRYLIGDNQEQFKKTKEFFKDVKENNIKAILSEFILGETIFVLTKFYKIDKIIVCNKLLELVQYRGFYNDDIDILILALEIFRDNNIDFADSLLCAKSKIMNYDIFSFDKDILKCQK